MPGLFVTATGTEVGKTYVTAALLRAGRRAGLVMDALKPMMTGFDPAKTAQSDAGLLLLALGRPVNAETLATMSPLQFAAPLAPNMAAAREGRQVVFNEVVDVCRRRLSNEGLTLIEGIGGVMVPLDERQTVLDLIADLSLPVLLVTGSRLGALSHCLTAYEVLKHRGRVPALIVLNESDDTNVPLDETHQTLSAFCARTPVLTVPRHADAQTEDRLLQAVLAALPCADHPSRGAGTAA